MANVYEKLMKVQTELKAPKNQRNNFGNYNYRSCEDILEGVKPLLASTKSLITISDNIEMIGDRIYVKAIAAFIDIEKGEKVEVSAFARESESKKGMDSSQVTGSTSSYARKYALNGLLCIDDTKDTDTDEVHKIGNKDVGDKKEVKGTLTEKQIKRLYVIAKNAGYNVEVIKTHVKKKFGLDHIHELSKKQYDIMCEGYEKIKK